MAYPDLCTVEDVKAWHDPPITASGDDEMLARLVTAESIAILKWLNINPENGDSLLSQSYTETFNGTGTKALALPNLPITAVASVSVNGVDIPESPQPDVYGFSFDKFAVYLTGACFRRGWQNVSISYTAGLASIPADLTQCAIEVCLLRYKRRKNAGLVSQAAAQQTTAFYTRDLPAETITRLLQYRKVTQA